MKTFFIVIILTALITWIEGQVSPALQADQAVLDIINNLGDNEGAFLPGFTVTDMFGGEGLAVFSSFATSGPGIRHYCNKWPYSKSRSRALYCGGNHGVPHLLNDVWEYDLASNTWVMIHKPDNGVHPCHTWWGVTYNQKTDDLYWMAAASNTMTWTWPLVASGVPLAVYDPYAQNGWGTIPNTSPNPNDGGNGVSQAGILEYIPGRDIVVWYGTDAYPDGMWSYNPNTNQWTELISKYEVGGYCDSCPGMSAVANYDRHSDVLVVFDGSEIYAYSFTANSWQKKGSSTFSGLASSSALAYDPIHNIHLHFKNGQISTYHYPTNTVQDITPTGQTLTSDMAMCYYDEKYNVFVFYDNIFGNNPHYVYRYNTDTVGINRISPHAPSMRLSVQPNPLRRTGRVLFTLGEAGQVSVALYNLQGKKVAALHRGTGQGGTQSLNVTYPDHLAAGVYIIGLKAGNRRTMKKIMISR
jgi:hypothetical protein